MAAGYTRTRVYGQIPGGEHILLGLDRGVLAVDFLPSQAYKTPIMIP